MCKCVRAHNVCHLQSYRNILITHVNLVPGNKIFCYKRMADEQCNLLFITYTLVKMETQDKINILYLLSLIKYGRYETNINYYVCVYVCMYVCMYVYVCFSN